MKKYTHKTEILTNEDDISFYLLGAYMTDGCIAMRDSKPISATLVSSDFEWIEKIKNIISPIIKLSKLKMKEKNFLIV